MSNLTSAEWAAWVQSVGSVVAIFVAALIAVLQIRSQHQNDLKLQRNEQLYAQLEIIKTIYVLASNSAKAMKDVQSQLKDRETVHQIAEGFARCDISELGRIDRYLAEIPLYTLPHSVVALTMMLGATLRQFKEEAELALQVHRKMDASAFEGFFRTLNEMHTSVELTCADIGKEVAQRQQEIPSS